MKKLLFFIASAALFQVYGSAAPCAPGSLASYIELGSAGCTLGNLQVADFTYHAKASGGAAEITAREIRVKPLLAPVGSFALQFSAPWDVQSGQDQFSNITYRVVAASTATPVQEVRLDGNGFKVGLYGSVVVNEALGATAATRDLEVYEKCEEVCRSQTSATLDLTPAASTLVVADRVALESRLGSAALTNFVDWFVVCIPCV
jgi:hypothetical protein